MGTSNKFVKVSWMPKVEALLVQLPFQIFLLIADADAEIDYDEVQAFLRLLDDPKSSSSPYSARIFRQTAGKYDSLSKKFRKGLIKKSYEQVEQSLKLIKSSSTPEQVTIFISDLEKLADRIASASGGFLNMGAVCKEEEHVIHKLKMLFNRIKNS